MESCLRVTRHQPVGAEMHRKWKGLTWEMTMVLSLKTQWTLKVSESPQWSFWYSNQIKTCTCLSFEGVDSPNRNSNHIHSHFSLELTRCTRLPVFSIGGGGGYKHNYGNWIHHQHPQASSQLHPSWNHAHITQEIPVSQHCCHTTAQGSLTPHMLIQTANIPWVSDMTL